MPILTLTLNLFSLFKCSILILSFKLSLLLFFILFRPSRFRLILYCPVCRISLLGLYPRIVTLLPIMSLRLICMNWSLLNYPSIIYCYLIIRVFSNTFILLLILLVLIQCKKNIYFHSLLSTKSSLFT